MKVAAMTEKHILHIEDNFHNRRIVRKILEKQGYELHEAADGVIGYNMIREMAPPLVLLDISLPGMDGIEIVQKVKGDDKLKHIIVIAVTASAMQGDRERFLAAGCDDYLSKPFRSIDLVDLVNQYYDQMPDSYMTPFKPRDVIHPIEEHSILAGPESVEWLKPTQEEPSVPAEPVQNISPLETASLQNIFGGGESDEYPGEIKTAEEETKEAEETQEATPAMTFTKKAESEEVDNDETTWVMPRTLGEPIERKTLTSLGGEAAQDNVPEEAAPEMFDVAEEEDLSGKEEYSVGDFYSETEETPEDTWAADTASLQGTFSEEDLVELDKLEDDLKEITTEADKIEEPVDEALQEIKGIQIETDENEGEITKFWDASDKTDELSLDTDFLQPPTSQQALEEVEEETSPELVSPTEAVERLMTFYKEEPTEESEPEFAEEQAEPATSFEEMTTAAPKADDIPAAWLKFETEEEAPPEPEASFDKISTAPLEAEELLTTEPAVETEEVVLAETATMDDEEELDLEESSKTEEIETLEWPTAHSRLDDTSPLREPVLETSKMEEPFSESLSKVFGKEDHRKKKEEESPQRDDLTDQVIRMINPDMIRPADPNVGVEGA